MKNNRDEKSLLHRIATNIDWLLTLSVIFLLGMGLVGIYSATLHYGNAGKFLATQLAAVTIGLAGFVILLSINYQFFRQSTYVIYALSSMLLISVLILGSTVRGTKGWFNLGYFSFQPVEIAKIAFILSMAGYLDKHWRDIKQLTKLAIPLVLLFGQVGIILLQPDFSSTLVYFPVALILLFAIGAEPLYLLAIIFFGAIAMGIPLLATFFKLQPAILAAHPVLKYFVDATHGGMNAIIILAGVVLLLFMLWALLRQLRIPIPFISFAAIAVIVIAGSVSSAVVQKSLKEYQRKRLIVFLSPEIDPLGSGYNIIQSKIAIGSGRFLGKGLFAGTQSQLGFLPEQHTDFIFSVFGEETGFFVSTLILFSYFLMIWRAMVVARESRDRYGSLVATGIAAMFAFYGVINIGMVMGLMPATGLPLPLLSYGGSCMVSSLWAIGILYSIHIRRFTHLH